MSDLVSVGRVGKPHGLDGSFFVEQASEDAQRFAVGARLHVDGETAEVVASKRSRSRPVIRLDREVRRGAELAVPRAELAATGENEYYAFELVAEHGSDRTLLGEPGERVRDESEDVELQGNRPTQVS